MEDKLPGKAVGAKLGRAMCAEFAGKRSAALEAAHPPASRHQVFVLEDGRVIDVFLKSARLYASAEEFRLAVNP